MSTRTVDIDKLAPEERLRLIGDLWDSLRAQPEAVRLTEAQRKELDGRLNGLDRGDASIVCWDEARSILRSQPE